MEGLEEVTDRLAILAGASPDDLRAGADALYDVGKRWIVEGGRVTDDTDFDAHNRALEQGSRLRALADALESAQKGG